MEILKTKPAIFFFGMLSLIGGIIFIDGNSMTGNVIGKSFSPVNHFSLIGILLFLCSIIFFAYFANELNKKR